MNLKANLKKRGWTIQQLAAKLTDKNGVVGVSHASASQIVNGNPTLNKLEEIAAIVGVSVSDLLREDDGDQMSASPAVVCPCCGAVLRVALSHDDECEGVDGRQE